MTAIERNGISGLVLKGAVIAFAALMFGCTPKAQTPAPAGAAPVVIAVL